MIRIGALAVAALLAVSACEDTSPASTGVGADVSVSVSEDSGPTVDGGDAGDDVVETNLLAPCDPAAPDTCAYVPSQVYEHGGNSEQRVTYTDVTGAERAVRFELRRPVNGPQPSPLIVWSHGGSSGKDNPAPVGVEWGEVFTTAGYVSLAIAHPGRDAASVQALCEALELGDCETMQCRTDDECSWGTGADAEPGTCTPDPALTNGYCRFFKNVNWDRPHDFSAILDWVEAESAGGMLDGVVDVNRIAYAGHSAGAGSTMMVAGAARRYRASAEDLTLVDTRPIAFMSCSPQGPGADGFTDESFTRERCTELSDAAEQEGCFTRPHLTLTGVGDGGDLVGESRRLSFDLAPVGDRYLGYITEPAAQHTTFEYGTDACARYAEDNALGGDYPVRCRTYRHWLRSAALAFFDATLRDDEAAQEYLSSDNLKVLGGAAFEWTAK